MTATEKQLTANISKMTLQAATIETAKDGHLIAHLGYEHVGMSTHFEFLNNGIEVKFK